MFSIAEKYSQAKDYILPYEQTHIETSINKFQILTNGLEIYSMEMDKEQWMVTRPPIEIREGDFIFRPECMVIGYSYFVKFKGDEFILIKRNQENVDLYTVVHGTK